MGLLASAVAVVMMGASLDANALALGAATVRSALGEPLRAEIEVPQVSSDEAATLKASIASPQSFRDAGIEYTAALSGARVSLQRRANGQAYLRIVGDRPVNEPFLGIVIEAQWANGRIVRDYTMLIDPPGRSAQAPVAVTQAPFTPVPAPAPVSAAIEPAVTQQATQVPPAPTVTRPAAEPRPIETPRRAAPPSVMAGAGSPVTVKRGDTAYRIASAHAAEGVSLDQMLVAMLRANPDAFIRGNVNRLRAGAVLNMPSAEQASAVSPQNARRTVLAQSRDFQAYRRSLAQRAQAARVAAAGRAAAGAVQAEVRDSQAPAPAQDRLTLSKGGSDAPAGTESSVAASRQAQEQSDRVAELNKNISELSRLQNAAAPGASDTPAAATAPDASASPGITVPVTPPAATEASAPAAAPAAAAPTEPASAAGPAADTAAAAVSAPASEAPAAAPEAGAAVQPPPPPAAPPVAPPPPVIEEPSFVASLMEGPLVPLAGAGLLALLAGYGLYRRRQRKNAAASLDSSFIASNLPADSFFGASGGQQVNTRNSSSGAGASSLAYSPSQLDAAGDVDPVAEADVYLAYGRDMQAEEILKEALVTQPDRSSIYRKLAEIYAKRRDARALEAIAARAHELTRGESPDWFAIAGLGAELDPANPLYQAAPSTAPVPAPAAPEPSPAAPAPVVAANAAPTPALPADDLDFDLDLDLDHAPVSDRLPLESAPTPTVAAAESAPAHDNALDFDLDFAPPSALPPAAEPVSAPAPEPTPGTAPTTPAAAFVSTPAPAPGMIEFDMEALSLDPDSRSGVERQTEQPEDADEDPSATKLALAQEFHAIGDTEGARSLVLEVIATASGTLKARAERFLAELS